MIIKYERLCHYCDVKLDDDDDEHTWIKEELELYIFLPINNSFHNLKRSLYGATLAGIVYAVLFELCESIAECMEFIFT